MLLYSKLASLLFPHVPDVASALASIIGNTGADALDPEGDGADQPVGERANGGGGDGNDGFSVEAAVTSSDATDLALSGSLSTLSDARRAMSAVSPSAAVSVSSAVDAQRQPQAIAAVASRLGQTWSPVARPIQISHVLVQALSRHSPTVLPPARRPTRPAHLQEIWKT